jgi:hypothetical protein
MTRAVHTLGQHWIEITLAALFLFIVAILFGHFGSHRNVAAPSARTPLSPSIELVSSVGLNNDTVEIGPPPGIAVNGYAYDPKDKKAPGKVTLLLDGQNVAVITPNGRNFSYRLPSGNVEAGRHELSTSFVSNDGRRLEVSRSKKRFFLGYSPNAPQKLVNTIPLRRATSLVVDAVVSRGASYSAERSVIKAYVPVGSPVLVTGWAIDSGASRDAGAVLGQIDDQAPVLADYGVERQDVAQALHGPYTYSGFALRLSTAGLKVGGSYPVRIKVVNSKKTAFFDARTKIELAIMATNFVAVESSSLSVIDSINDTLAAPYANGKSALPLQRSSRNVVRGWAADADNNTLAREIDVAIDGRIIARAAYDVNRPDVAAFKSNPALGRSGFEAVIRPNTLPIGQHRLTLFIKGATGRTVRSLETIPVEVR